MKLKSRIEAFDTVGKQLISDTRLNELITKSGFKNPWFTEDNYHYALKAISDKFLMKEKLEKWLEPYHLSTSKDIKVGLIMAGNIPLVGFHDFLSVLVCGLKAQIKLSDKDNLVMPYLAKLLIEAAPEFQNQIEFVEKLQKFNLIIATGSNNSARYFNYYFGKYPNLIRRNRVSVAVLTGDETDKELSGLGEDIFRYYGLGCRNVSKIFVPKDYDLVKLMDHLAEFKDISDHNKYKNNFDYNLTIQILNKSEHLVSEFLIMIKEPENLVSPISAIYVDEYNNQDDLSIKLALNKQDIQCIVGHGTDWIPFGEAQKPELWDYADNIDTIRFLQESTGC